MMTIMEHVHANGTNGQRGRQAPALPEHTFKDSGITIRIRKVGPTVQQHLAQQIRREIPEPTVPVIDTALGPEPNAADPAYIVDKANWEQQTNLELSNRLMIIAALEAEITIDEQARADIARKQRHLKLIGIPYQADPNMTDAENEKVFYILHVAASTPEDLRDFGAAVLRRSVPTEEAVQSQIATFQRDVPREADI